MYETTEDLRKSILQDLTDLREGKINNAQARARAALTRTVIDTISVEIAAANLGRAFDPIRIASMKTVGQERPRPRLASKT